eukprot:8183381-Ditylum_brightwellii.AAC.1
MEASLELGYDFKELLSYEEYIEWYEKEAIKGLCKIEIDLAKKLSKSKSHINQRIHFIGSLWSNNFDPSTGNKQN